MEPININNILNREQISEEIKNILNNFDNKINDISYKKGIFILGSPGCGKTTFVTNILKDLNYSIINYDAGDIRNKSIINNMTNNNITKQSVLEILKKSNKKIAVVMDEIDAMVNGDKGGITSLIKLIRQKKTKKQKLENITINPIICIGNFFIDKKIKELKKVCYVFQLHTPPPEQISRIINLIMPILNDTIKQTIIKYIQGDLRKIKIINNIYKKNHHLLTEEIIKNIFQEKSFNEEPKKITKLLIENQYNINSHNILINDTDRTIVALLWHENIVDVLNPKQYNITFPFYLRVLENICYADYIDRITFQNQIWQFNEMSSLIKTFYNNKIYHDTFNGCNKEKIDEIRFTKVLTKYSTEYNNILFIFNLCQELDMNIKDLFCFFQELRIKNYNFKLGDNFYNNIEFFNNTDKIFENYNINKLDIKRIYRYLDNKNTKKENINEEDEINELEDCDIDE